MGLLPGMGSGEVLLAREPTLGMLCVPALLIAPGQCWQRRSLLWGWWGIGDPASEPSTV